MFFEGKSVAKKQHVEYMQQYLHVRLNICFIKIEISIYILSMLFGMLIALYFGIILIE
jgi:hypothetical protein